jgi:hypothetical protein
MDDARSKELCEEIESIGQKALAVKCDITIDQPGSVPKAGKPPLRVNLRVLLVNIKPLIGHGKLVGSALKISSVPLTKTFRRML